MRSCCLDCSSCIVLVYTCCYSLDHQILLAPPCTYYQRWSWSSTNNRFQWCTVRILRFRHTHLPGIDRFCRHLQSHRLSPQYMDWNTFCHHSKMDDTRRCRNRSDCIGLSCIFRSPMDSQIRCTPRCTNYYIRGHRSRMDRIFCRKHNPLGIIPSCTLLHHRYCDRRIQPSTDWKTICRRNTSGSIPWCIYSIPSIYPFCIRLALRQDAQFRHLSLRSMDSRNRDHCSRSDCIPTCTHPAAHRIDRVGKSRLEQTHHRIAPNMHFRNLRQSSTVDSILCCICTDPPLPCKSLLCTLPVPRRVLALRHIPQDMDCRNLRHCSTLVDIHEYKDNIPLMVHRHIGLTRTS
mmetsp:Transcript_71559/g.113893  ORF Transcript_71559/g.113893 Transcript_71559/m.113893 type:complete len:347 (-) Transcript_71559:1031-2071(-)